MRVYLSQAGLTLGQCAQFDQEVRPSRRGRLSSLALAWPSLHTSRGACDRNQGEPL